MVGVGRPRGGLPGHPPRAICREPCPLDRKSRSTRRGGTTQRDALADWRALFGRSSAVEQSAVNRLVVGSNPTAEPVSPRQTLPVRDDLGAGDRGDRSIAADNSLPPDVVMGGGTRDQLPRAPAYRSPLVTTPAIELSQIRRRLFIRAGCLDRDFQTHFTSPRPRDFSAMLTTPPFEEDDPCE